MHFHRDFSVRKQLPVHIPAGLGSHRRQVHSSTVCHLYKGKFARADPCMQHPGTKYEPYSHLLQADSEWPEQSHMNIWSQGLHFSDSQPAIGRRCTSACKQCPLWA